MVQLPGGTLYEQQQHRVLPFELKMVFWSLFWMVHCQHGPWGLSPVLAQAIPCPLSPRLRYLPLMHANITNMIYFYYNLLCNKENKLIHKTKNSHSSCLNKKELDCKPIIIIICIELPGAASLVNSGSRQQVDGGDDLWKHVTCDYTLKLTPRAGLSNIYTRVCVYAKRPHLVL